MNAGQVPVMFCGEDPNRDDQDDPYSGSEELVIAISAERIICAAAENGGQRVDLLFEYVRGGVGEYIPQDTAAHACQHAQHDGKEKIIGESVNKSGLCSHYGKGGQADSVKEIIDGLDLVFRGDHSADIFSSDQENQCCSSCRNNKNVES